MVNSFGNLFRITTFGESHGAGLGCVVDGCPAGVPLDMEDLLAQLARRRPGQSAITTRRSEADAPAVLSGVFEGRTLGTPIAMIVENTNQRSSDYDSIKRKPRKGHADQTWKDKFDHIDHRGGGRASGRETVGRVLGGWVAESLLRQLFPQMSVVAHVSSVGELSLDEENERQLWTRDQVDTSPTRCPDQKLALEMERMLSKAKEAGESYGGEVTVTIQAPPASLGEPVFYKFQNQIANALTSIGTVNGITWNEKPLSLPGSEFHRENTYGGLNGGITNGADMRFKVHCKPVSTIGDLARAGRHDPCVLPRVVPVVEAMTALVLADFALMQRTRNL